MAPSAVQARALAYATTSFAIVTLNVLFSLYYVDLYISVYKVSSAWWKGGQSAFLVWNAINDPLFGWLSDHSDDPAGRRIPAISRGSLWLCLAFLFPWFFISDASSSTVIGLHFLLALSFYDALFTYVVLQHCSLMADLTTSAEDRVMLSKYHSIAQLLASVPVALSYLFWDRSNLAGFRAYAVAIAFMAWLCMRHTVSVIQERRVHTSTLSTSPSSVPATAIPLDQHLSIAAILRFAREILTHGNFVFFVIMNFAAIFANTAAVNYLPLHMRLIETSSPNLAVLAVSASQFLPSAAAVAIVPLLKSLGSYQLFRLSFLLRIALCIGAAVVGASPLAVAVFVVLNRIIGEAPYTFANMVVCDIVDEDYLRHKRRHTMSSMVFGTNALLTKPAQSLAPMLVWSILAPYALNTSTTDDKSTPSSGTGSGFDALPSSANHLVFSLAWAVPLVSACVQWLAWSQYTLHSQRLAAVKRGVSGDTHRTDDDGSDDVNADVAGNPGDGSDEDDHPADRSLLSRTRMV